MKTSRLLLIAVALLGTARLPAAVYNVNTQADWNALSSRTYVGGDQIILLSGATFSTAGGKGWFAKGSATSGNPITVKTSAAARARIAVDPDAAGVGNKAIEFDETTNNGGWKIDNLEIYSPGGRDAPGFPAGIMARVNNAPLFSTYTFVRITNCYFHDIGKCTDFGVDFDSTAYDQHWNDVTIDRCDFTNVGYPVNFGLKVPGDPATPERRDSYATNIVVSNCMVSGTKYTGINTANTNGMKVQFCGVTNWCEVNGDGSAIWGFCDNSIVEYNEIYNRAANAQVAVGVYDHDYDGVGNTYRYNYSHDNAGLSFVYANFANANNSTFCYNLSVNDSNCAFWPHNAATNVRIFNNVVYAPGKQIDLSYAGGGFAHNFSNNIFWGSSLRANSTNTYTNNCFWGGMTGVGTAQKNANPLFQSVTNADVGFKLLAGSPCIDAGVAITGNPGKDYYDRTWTGTAYPGGAANIGIDEGPGIGAAVEVIVDNNTAGKTLAAPSEAAWATSTWAGGGAFYGSDYRHDNNAPATGKYYQWRPNLPQAGTYKVYLRWSAATTRASNVQVVIYHNGTRTTVQNVNMRVNGGQWNEIGTWNFGTATDFNDSVAVTTYLDAGGLANGFVIADAVRFVKQ